MPKTTRPRVRVGEWLECWAYAELPSHGRVRGVVTSVDLSGSNYHPYVTFELKIAPDSAQPIPDFYFVNEIIRRLRPHEIITLKLQGVGV